MEAVIVVLLLAVLGVLAIGVWLMSAANRRPPADADAQRLEVQTQRLEAQLAAAKAELAQAVSASQQTMLERVSSVDQRLDTRLEAVQAVVDRRLDAMGASVSQRLEAVDSRVGQGFSAVQTDLNKTLTSQSETMGKIGEQLGALDQSAKRIMEVGQDVSSLKDVLSPPKLRGAFGEMLLEQLLKQVLPAAHYQTQYQFRDGTRVDVVITTPDGLVPVDSKFPIESYRRLAEATTEEERVRLRRAFMRDVKARVEEVAKYIRPGENTLDFACMYVPAEGIFYEIIAGGAEEDSMTFALERQVHLVSPNTFYALLQVVSRGLARLQVQQDVKEFMARLSHVRRDFAKFRTEFDTLGTHLGRARNKYDELDKWADKIDNRLAASADEPVQAPLPDAAMAPAPLVPSLTNGNGHDED
jgi:DNA recombination protein RmuC